MSGRPCPSSPCSPPPLPPPPPRPPPSAECTRREHPVVSFQALSPWISSFSHPGVRDFSQLTLDLSRNQLIVGARNYLFRLSLSNISLIQATEWGPDEDTRRSCQSKGKTEAECQNYIRVLLVNGKRVFTCGTNAFLPVCTTRQIGNMSRVLDKVNGCVYAATRSLRRDPVIYRSTTPPPW
ncbi:hypothetical protein ANANG_G00053610 [Anguilla anguilla]|uniref:Sema domain-containing protein n=1 Tax=Anguilla anguilla TaxID=7936 RepID=A0A9D3S1X4_ANGAN|nr:hypothetical protein ANANG_G00053610 [Anguilla anguilla]